MAALRVDWDTVFRTGEEELLTAGEEAVDGLYAFLLSSSVTGITDHLKTPDSLVKILGVAQTLFKMKDREAQELITALETSQQQRQTHTYSSGREVMVLRQEVDDLRRELSDHRRVLDVERREKEKIGRDLIEERRSAYDLQLKIDQHAEDIAKYREHLDRDMVGGGWEILEQQLRKRLWEQEREMADQLDRIEKLISQHDEMQSEKEELLALLETKEQLSEATAVDMERRQQALEEASRQVTELDRRKEELENEKADLADRHHQLSKAHAEVVQLFQTKAKENEIQLKTSEEEMNKMKETIASLQAHLKLLQKDTNKASMLKMKKQLTDKDAHIEQLQQEMAQAAADVLSLSHQLEEAQHKADPNHVNNTLLQDIQQARQQCRQLETELGQEQARRIEAEKMKAEREKEMVQIQQQLEQYEEGTFGLREAVREIKQKKEEISVRDSDIAKLSHEVTVLQGQTDLLMEQNSALRLKLGLGPNDTVSLQELREKREQDEKRLRKQNTELSLEVERLKNEKTALRKKIVDQALALSISADRKSSSSDPPQNLLSELMSQKSQLESCLELEKQRKLACEKEVARLNQELQDRHKQHTNTSATRGNDSTDGSAVDDKARLLSQLSELKSNNARLHAKVKTMEGQKKSLEAKLELKSAETVSLRDQLDTARITNPPSLSTPHHHVRGTSTTLPLTGGDVNSQDTISSLQDHLFLMIREVKQKEQELAKCQQSMDKMSQRFSVIIHQQGILYKEHQDREAAWEKQTEETKKEKEELMNIQLQQEVKLQEFKELQDTLASGPDAVKQRLVELTRRVTILKVNERILSRRFSLLQLREAMLRKENEQFMDQNSFRESAVTKRIGFLQRYKEAMSIKLGHLHDQLSHSVSVSMLEEANTKYAKLVCKYQTVLQQVRMEGETDDNLSVGTRLTRVAWTNDQEGLSPDPFVSTVQPALESRVRQLEQSIAALKAENTELKESAEIAAHQLELTEGRRRRDEQVESALRDQLEELQVQNERKTNIAMLQQQLLSLQVSEGVALRRVEEGRSRELRLQASLLSCEQQQLEMEEEISKVKMDFTSKIQCLRKFIQSLRRIHVGCVKLVDQEKYTRLVQEKQSSQLELKWLLTKAEEEREKVKEERQQLVVQQTNLHDLISATKDGRGALARMTECHSKLSELRLKEMRYERRTRKLESQLQQVESLLAASELSCAELEERLAQATEALEAACVLSDEGVTEQDKKMKMSTELPNALEEARQQISHLKTALRQAEEEVTVKNRSLAELQHKLRLLPDTSSISGALRTAKQRISQLEATARLAEEEATRKNMRVMELQQQLVTAEEDRGWREREDELRGVLQLANDTISHLKSQLAHKETQVEKYHQLLQKSRMDHQIAQETHREEIRRLRVKEQQKAAVGSKPPSPPPVIAEQQVARTKELEDLVMELRQKNSTISQELQDMSEEAKTHKAQWKRESDQMKRHIHKMTSTHKHQVKELEGLVSIKASQVENLEIGNGQLKQEVEDLKQEVEVIAQLRAEMEEKEEQMARLLEALQNVRSDLVETVQQTLECHDNGKQAQDDFQQVIKEKIREVHREREVRKDLETQLVLTQQTKTQFTILVESLQEQLKQSEKECQLLKQSLVEMSRKNQVLDKEVNKLQDSLPGHSNELQKLRTRCSILQAKVEKQQKELLEACRQGEARMESHETATQVSPQPLAHDEYSKVHVARWEEGKRWQKRVEGLKVKLKKKTTELEAATVQISTLEKRISGFNRDQSLLQGRVRSGKQVMSEGPIQKVASAGGVSAEEVYQLRTQVFNLQTELSSLQKQLQSKTKQSDQVESSELLLANKQLQEANTALKMQIDKLTEQNGEREGEWSVLTEREDSLREQLLCSHKEGIRLQFLLDQTTMELERLRSRVTDQQHFIKALKELEEGTTSEFSYVERVEEALKTTGIQLKRKPTAHSSASAQRVVEDRKPKLGAVHSDGKLTNQASSRHKLTQN